jgi:hypothetical protein
MTHPITPPPELVEQWEEQFLERPTINGCFIQSYIAAKAAQWGADQELNECCEFLLLWYNGRAAVELVNKRRPKPPTLREQALKALKVLPTPDGQVTLDITDLNTIRRALEALPQ